MLYFHFFYLLRTYLETKQSSVTTGLGEISVFHFPFGDRDGKLSFPISYSLFPIPFPSLFPVRSYLLNAYGLLGKPDQ